MGKNHRHKKNMKAEKAKVKLKVKNEKTKFLPKGQNVTDLSFKVKQIVIPEQLKEKDQTELRSRRNLNCLELLKRLKHHNTFAKLEACDELGQLINACNEEYLQLHLASITRDISPLILDIEHKVRLAAVKVIDILLSKASENKFETFFKITLSYLKCAMTHLDASRQEDSVALLDSLLKHVPKLVACNADQLISHLIPLISNLKGCATPERTLKVVMGTKLTSNKWRTTVLQRIRSVLEAVDVMDESDNEHLNDGEKSAIFVTDNGPYYIPIYVDPFEKARSTLEFSASVSVDEISNYGSSLMGLLFETWFEEKNVEGAGEEVTLLEKKSIVILETILTIMMLLWKCTKKTSGFKLNPDSLKSQFVSETGKKFWRTLLSQFPYALSIDDVRVRGKSAKSSDPKCLKENLLICQLYCILDNGLRINNLTNIKHIVNYVIGLLPEKKKSVGDNLMGLADILRVLLVESSEILCRKGINYKEILDSLLPFYDNLQIGPLKVELFKIISDISALPHLTTHIDYDLFLRTFTPLVSSTHFGESAMVSLKYLTRRRHTDMFNKAFESQIPAILETILELENSETVDFHFSKRKPLMEILAYAKLSEEHLKMMNQYTSLTKDEMCRKYMTTVLDQRQRI